MPRAGWQSKKNGRKRSLRKNSATAGQVNHMAKEEWRHYDKVSIKDEVMSTKFKIEI